MSAPTCPRHKSALTLLEEGVLNGVTVRYWGRCAGVTCQFHQDNAFAQPRGGGCRCAPCRYETRTEDSDHVELDLFQDQEATV